MAIAFVLFFAAVPLSQAQMGSARMSWNQCDPIQRNVDFTGPGQLVSLIFSMSGVEEPHHGVLLVIRFRPNVPDAWRFDYPGCNGGQMYLATEATGSRCPKPHPSYGGSFGILYEFDTPGELWIGFSAGYSSMLQLDPNQRYALLQLHFLHNFSVAGAADPAEACGGADQRLCIWLSEAGLFKGTGLAVPMPIDNDFVTWNDPGNAMQCPDPVQAESGTWGRVKSLYR